MPFDPSKPRPNLALRGIVAVPDAFDYLGTVDRVVDGDTVVVTLSRDVDLGFGLTASLRHTERLRLAGLDAKPLKTDLGDRAAAWLGGRTGNGRVMHIVTVKNALGEDKYEKYGRLLAFLYEVDEQTGKTLYPSLNESMIDVGLAKPWDGKGPHPGAGFPHL